MADRPLILVSNDDGVSALGINTLREKLLNLGEVVVVAPASEQSAKSHAITLHEPLNHRLVSPGVHAIDGTPADCVLLALLERKILPRRPDLIVSGINHGPNLGQDVFYSGTVAAAREGALKGFRAIAFSLDRGGDFSHAANIARDICSAALNNLPEAPSLWNVNFPKRKPLGIKATRLGIREYNDEVVSLQDAQGQDSFRIRGISIHHPPMENSDTAAFDSGFVSITPLNLSLTAVDQIPMLNGLVSKLFS